MLDWLWQSLTSRLVWELLLVLGGGAVLGYVRQKLPQYAPTVAYTAFGATCIAVLIFTFTGHALLSKQKPEVTPENLEVNVRKWADDLGLGVTRMQPLPNQDVQFGLVITLADGNPLMVFRSAKDKAGFLQMQCVLVLSPEHLAMLNKLSKQEADDAMQDIILEMNRSRIGYIMETAPSVANGQVTTTTPTILQQTIIVTKPLAITDELTEALFGAQVNEMDSEIGIVRLTTNSTLERYTRQQEVTPRAARQ
jgi:hypothetical protein